MDAVLVCSNVEKCYGRRGAVTRALAGVSLSVAPGEFVAIMGASGSGKTTLLNCIATIDTVTSGHIYVEGRDVTAMRRAELARWRRERLGYIFQDGGLLDTLTARENIALALTVARIPAHEVSPRVERIAAHLGVTEVLDKFPHQMSGGQRQRVAAARAIVGDPAIVLADEPTGALDSKNARLLLECMRDLNEGLGATVLMVTHDAYAASYAHRVVFIRDGRTFSEVVRGAKARATFFDEIMGVVAFLGGGAADAETIDASRDMRGSTAARSDGPADFSAPSPAAPDGSPAAHDGTKAQVTPDAR